ncbi:MAG: (Fe-S)-binding protein [Promethearchaeota archaeon]
MLYLIGCTLSYKEREIAQITVKIFKKLGIDFIIFENESYYDSPLLRTGRYDQALELMKHNIKMIEDSRDEKVVFSCAGCYRAFNSDYQKELGKLGFKLQHISQFLDNLLNENKLKLKNKEKIVTYRNSCHIGRHEKIYDEPRSLIKAIPGIKLNEKDRNLINVWCCGAGSRIEPAFKNPALNTSK